MIATVVDASQPDPVGRVIADRYRITRRVGGGGMGSVWEAEHVTLGTPFAIKLIRPELATTETARARFLREAKSAATLRGPHVVETFDCGVDDGAPYIAMELLEGESLAARLRDRGSLDAAQTLAVVAQVCRALGRAHAAGIVHRDLKPDNIFIVVDGGEERVKVVDFGIAKGIPTDAETHSGALLGTPFYMAPEQARDASHAEARSDLWSVAVVAYECLVGRRPFEGESIASLAVKILVEPIPVPSEHGTVPAGFDAWFARATQREPAARFQRARELVTALAEALELDAPSLSPMPVAPRAPRPGIARWVGVAAVVSALGVIAWFATRPTASAPPTGAVPTDTVPTAPPAPIRAPDAAPVVAPPPPPSAERTEPEPESAPPKRRPKPRPRRQDVDDLEF